MKSATIRQLSIVSRIASAVFGGYALTYAAAAALATLLPMVRSEAAVTAMLSGLLIFAGAVMWVFSARSATRAWCVLLILTLVCAVLAWLPGMQT